MSISLQHIILTSDDSTTVVPTHQKCADQRLSTPREKPRATAHEDQQRVSGSKQYKSTHKKDSRLERRGKHREAFPIEDMLCHAMPTHRAMASKEYFTCIGKVSPGAKLVLW
jgi:hypothetical protein